MSPPEPAPRPARAGLPDRPLRAWLFVPGAAERYVRKLAVAPSDAASAAPASPAGAAAPPDATPPDATPQNATPRATLRAGTPPGASPPQGATPDAVVFDLEDGVAASELAAARRRVRGLLEPDGPALPAPLCVRVHAVSTPTFEEDLAALGPRLAALVLPKVGSAEEVRHAAARLKTARLGHAGLVLLIETAAGLEALPALLRAHPAVAAVAFGAEDFAADLGLPPRTAEPGSPQEDARAAFLDAARARIVVAAVAAGVRHRIDSPTLVLGDPGRVERDAKRSRALGFEGRFAIHPDHLAPLRRGFAPNPAEIRWASAILGAEGASAADGARAAGGQMVDEAVARQARAILAAAEEGSP